MVPMLLSMMTLASSPSPGRERRPVVVELFSSEGCSSCPAADAVLDELDRDQPVPGAEVVALELHVDYWNRLGWADPFSRAEFSARQARYAQAFHLRGVYTPQAVVDGADEAVGSESGTLRSEIAKAAARPAARVSLALRGDMVALQVSSLPAGADDRAEVWLAITERGLSTDVPRGENAGRHLRHGPVVRELAQVGTLRDGRFARELPFALPAGVKPERARIVAFVQEHTTRHIVGAAAIDAR